MSFGMHALALGGSFARGVWMEVLIICPVSDVWLLSWPGTNRDRRGSDNINQPRAGGRVMRDTDYKHTPIL